jgi:hypothetical protein
MEKGKLTRKKCPFCSESILSTAKKCRFCGEWLEKKNKPNLLRRIANANIASNKALLVLLLILLSVGAVFAKQIEEVSKKRPTNVPKPTVTPAPIEQDLLRLINDYRKENNKDIFLKDEQVCRVAERIAKTEGVTSISISDNKDICPSCNSYGMNLATDIHNSSSVLNSWLNDKKTESNLLGNYKYACVARYSNRIALIFANKSTQQQNISTQQNTGTQQNVNNGNQVECIGPDGKHFNTTLEECKKFNESWGKSVDYMLNCNIHPDCGGGTVWMSKSQCEKPCSGQTNKASTNTQTTSSSTSNNSSKTATFLSYLGYTLYCPPGNVGAAMSINSTLESKKMEWAKNYNDCTNLFVDTDSCWVNCADTNHWSDCNYGTPEYQSCMDATDKNYQDCTSTCPSLREHCDYVYAEQKSLIKQISNLCNY